MSRSLLRPCLGCGRQVRGKPRCAECQRDHDRPKDQAKRARRPDLHSDAAERERRRRAVATHRATVGDWCPGVPELRRPAHPAANLSADHAVEVAAGGDPRGPLVVRCVPCNSARSANVTRRALAELGGSPHRAAPTTPLPAEHAITHPPDDSPGGLVVA
jgi:5-methylcytosine-specific restriction protein A